MSNSVNAPANDQDGAAIDVKALAADVLRECNVRLDIRDPVFIAVLLNQQILERSLQRLASLSAKTAATAARHEVAQQLNQLDAALVARFNEGSAAFETNARLAIEDGTARLKAGVNSAADSTLGEFANAVSDFRRMMKRVEYALYAVLGVIALGAVLVTGIEIGRLL